MGRDAMEQGKILERGDRVELDIEIGNQGQEGLDKAQDMDTLADVAESVASAEAEGIQSQGGKFHCEPPCQFKAKTAWKLQRHQNAKQGCVRGLLLPCEYCGENVGRADKLRAHLKKDVCLSRHSCDKCPQKFSTVKLLREHKTASH